MSDIQLFTREEALEGTISQFRPTENEYPQKKKFRLMPEIKPFVFNNVPEPGTKEADLWRQTESMPNPEEERARIDVAMAFSNATDIEFETAYQNVDSLIEVMANGGRGGGREYMEMKATEAREYLGSMHEIGQLITKRGRLGFDMLQNGVDEEKLELSQELDQEMQKLYEQETENPFLWAVGQAANMWPMMFEGMKKGAQRGAGLAASFAGAAAAAGQVPPLTVVPEEIATVPGAAIAGFSVGMAWGTAESTFHVEGGNFFMDMVNEGVDPDIAQWAALGGGFLSALVETVQVNQILSNLPGLENIVRSNIGKVVKEAAGKVTKSSAGKLALTYGMNVATETGEEVIQEVIQIASEDLVKRVNNQVHGTEYEGAWQDAIPRIMETAKSSAAGLSVIGLPGLVGNAMTVNVRELRDTKPREQVEKLYDEVAQDLTPEDKKEVNARLGMDVYAEIRVLEEEKAKLEEKYADQPTVLAAELIKNQREIDFLRDQKFKEEVKKNPKPWMMTRTEWESTIDERVQQRGELIFSDEFKQRIADNMPQLAEEEVEGAAILVQLRAEALGMTRDQYLSTTFQPQIFAEQDRTRGVMKQESRGAIEFTEDAKALFHATKASDFSTFAHEMAHVWRKELMGEDLRAAEEWAGVKEGTWTREAEEKFAKHFERYLQEGYAPSEQLRSVFQKFAEWMRKVFAYIGERWDLSPEIRGVYDRLFAPGQKAQQLQGEGVLYQEVNNTSIDSYQLSDKWTFKNVHRDYHHGQNDYIAGLLDDSGEVVSQVAYSIFDEEIHVNMIETFPEYQRQGAARELLVRIRKENEGMPIEPGMQTETGAALVQDMTERNILFQPAPPVDSEAFKKWFGDSKVVDENGDPLVVYHGTDKFFDEFDNWLPNFFTETKEYTKGFGDKQMAAYLSIQRPFDPENDKTARKMYNDEFVPWAKETYRDNKRYTSLTKDEKVPFTTANTLFVFLRRKQREDPSFRYDGILIDEHIGEVTAWVPLQNTQIKSVHNKGTWDQDNPNILFQPAPPVDSEAFRKWFGDSKVVDENGDPLVVYHGGATETSAFRSESSRGNMGAAYFTDDPFVASAYAVLGGIDDSYTADEASLQLFGEDPMEEGRSGRITPAFLSISKPIDPASATQITSDMLLEFYKSELSGWIKEEEFQGTKKEYVEQLLEKDPFRGMIEYDGISLGDDVSAAFATLLYKEDLKSFMAEYGYDGVIYEDLEAGGKTYIPLNPEQIKSVYNKGVWDPDSPNILYKDFSHRDSVREAVEAGLPVPDNVLQEYADEDWAQEEFRTRSEYAADAITFETMDQYVSFAQSMDPQGRPASYHEYIYNQSKMKADPSRGTDQLSLTIGNQKFVESVTKPVLVGYLQEAIRRGSIQGLHGVIQTAAKAAVKNNDITDAHYKKAMDQIKADPAYYREDFAILLEDTEELAQMQREREADPAAAEIEELQRNLSQTRADLRKSKERLGSYQDRIYNLDARVDYWTREHEKRKRELKEFAAEIEEAEKDATKSARQEARLQKEQAVKEAKQQMREAQKAKKQAKDARDYFKKVVSRIMKPPSAAIAWDKAQRIKEIQGGLAVKGPRAQEYIDRQHLKRVIDKNPDAGYPAEVLKEANRVSVHDLTIDDIENIYDEVKSLRNMGRLEKDIMDLEERIWIDQHINSIFKTVTGGYPPTDKNVGSVEAKEARRTPAGKKAKYLFMRPDRVVEVLGGGPFKKLFRDYINDAQDSELVELNRRYEIAQDMMKSLDIAPAELGRLLQADGAEYTVDDVIHMWIALQDEDSEATLYNGNNIDPDTVDSLVSQLEEKHIRWGQFMMDEFSEENFERINQILRETENREMVKVEKYFPIRRAGQNIDSFKDELKNEILDRYALKRAYPGKKFTIERTHNEGAAQIPMRLGATNLFFDQLQKQESFIAKAQLAKRLHRIFRNEDVSRAIRQKFGDEMNNWVEKYINDWVNPNIYKVNDTLHHVSRVLRSHAALSYLGFNLLTPLKQLPSLAFFLADAGPFHMLGAATEMLFDRKETRRLIDESDPQVKYRSFDRITEELKLQGRGAYDRFVQKVGKAGMSMIQFMDRQAILTGWKAVYNKAKADGLSHEDAVRKAKDVTLRTQPQASAKDLPQAYRTNEILNWFLMFSNQLNQIWNMITHDIPQDLKNRKWGHAMGTTSAVVISGLMIGMLSRRRVPDEPEELYEDVRDQLLSAIPVVGGNIKAGISGWWGTGVDPVPVASEIGALIRDIEQIAKDDADMELRTILRVIESAMVTGGLPTVQPRRTIKSIINEDPWELIGGTWGEEE